VVAWREVGIVWKKVLIDVYSKCSKKFHARKCN
jgi:hypothetical protein